MSGLNILSILLEKSKSKKTQYNELLNALIIHDDIRRCIKKPDNKYVVDHNKNKNSLTLALSENEQLITQLIKEIIS